MKPYKKPIAVSNESIRGIVPLAGIAAAATTVVSELAPAAALLGAYAAGKSVSRSMGYHIDSTGNGKMVPVIE